ncbi:MAG: hypothetical protein VB071_03330, partial [Lawsonibacter sp.]|nr:hypothetical protein [Lawsonibacter sp.]
KSYIKMYFIFDVLQRWPPLFLRFHFPHGVPRFHASGVLARRLRASSSFLIIILSRFCVSGKLGGGQFMKTGKKVNPN